MTSPNISVQGTYNRGRNRSESGSALVLFGLCLTLLLGVSALVMDMGRVFLAKLQMQSAADSAALAAVHELATIEGVTQTDVEAIVTEFATENDAGTIEILTLDWDTRSIEVKVSRQIPSIFAQIFGIESFSVSATSAASAFSVGETGDLIPIIVQDSLDQAEGWIQSETIVNLWDNAPEGSGNFGWVDWNGGSNSAVELAQTIANPTLSGFWAVGDQVQGLTGISVASEVRNGLQTWVGRHFTVPLYSETVYGGANLYYTISGFAEFQLLSFNLTSSPKRLTGLFIRHVKLGSRPGGEDSKLSTVVLTN